MFYYLNKWLFILTARSLVKKFKSGSSSRRNKVLSSRAEKINKYLIRYLLDVNEAIEYPSFKLLDAQDPNLYIARIPKDIRDRCDQFSDTALDPEGEEFNSKESEASASLIFFDINDSEDAIRSDSFEQDAQKAANKLVEEKVISVDYGDNQQT